MKIYPILFFLLMIQLGFSQTIEVTYQSNGTTIGLPIESIDSLKIDIDTQPALKKIYQNNGNILGISISDVDSITYEFPNFQILPTLSTNEVNLLSPTSAKSGGEVESDGGSTILKKGVCWNTSPNPTLANNFTVDGAGLNNFVSNVLPLSPSTTYYLRSYATNQNGTAYGNEVSFKTPNPDSSVLPVVTTNGIDYDDGLSAIGKGSVSINDGSITSKGFCWAVGSTPTIDNNRSFNGSEIGDYSGLLADLLPNITYTVRAYATNNAGVAYGEEFTFTTHDYPSNYSISSEFAFYDSASVRAQVMNDGGSEITDRGVCWSTDNNPTTEDNSSSIGSGKGSYYKTQTNLNSGTTYFFRPYAKNGIGISYGNTIEVKTSNSISDLDDLYALMHKPGTGGTSSHIDFGQKGFDIFGDMLSGDMALTKSTYGWYRSSITQFSATQNSYENQNYMVWRYYTRVIHASNAIIESLSPTGDLPTSDDQKSWALGQALALRAHSYFYLLHFFQEDFNSTEALFPLYEGLQFDNDKTPVQTEVIYNLIENDLQNSIFLLDNYTRPSKKHINKPIAKTILAYILASRKDRWQDVVAITNDALNTTTASLMQADNSINGISGGFNDVNSTGWMWGIDLNADIGLGLVSWWGQMDAFSYSYAAAGDNKAMDQDLYESMRPDDVRRDQFLNNPSSARHLQPLFKFYDSDRVIFGSSQIVKADYIYMRYAEPLLLNIEALAKSGSEGAAKTKLENFVSARGMDPSYISALNGQALEDEIYKQTRLEFWGEGKTYLAMKRNEAVTKRGPNHLSFVGEIIAFNDDRLTFELFDFDDYDKRPLQSLNCDAIVFSNDDPLIEDQEINNLTFEIPYAVDAGGNYEAIEFYSSGTTGLTASIDSGTYNSNGGVLIFTITGTPNDVTNYYGTPPPPANFEIKMGGRTCNVSIDIESNGVPYECTATDLLTLSFVFDGYASEVSWSITDMQDRVIYVDGGYSDGQESFSTELCLNDGNYKFVLNDSFGDGLSFPSEGSATLTYQGEVLLQASGDYGSQFIGEFIIQN